MAETEQPVPNNGRFELMGKPNFRGMFFVRFRLEMPFCPVLIRGRDDYYTVVYVRCHDPGAVWPSVYWETGEIPSDEKFSTLRYEDIARRDRRHTLWRFAESFGHEDFVVVACRDISFERRPFTGFRIAMYGRLNWLEGGIRKGGFYDFLGWRGGAPLERPTLAEAVGLFKAHNKPHPTEAAQEEGKE